MILLWLKALHLIFMVSWFAGLLYLPRLFVYHAQATDKISLDRFCVMERRLFRGIMTPAAIGTLACGLGMLSITGMKPYGHWLHAKLGLIALLLIYHVMCKRMVMAFQENRNERNHVFYRFFNEVPAIFLIFIVILAVVRPF